MNDFLSNNNKQIPFNNVIEIIGGSVNGKNNTFINSIVRYVHKGKSRKHYNLRSNCIVEHL